MAEAPAPPDRPSPPRRPWTLLGRLTEAVREQNWVAVVLEVVIADLDAEVARLEGTP